MLDVTEMQQIEATMTQHRLGTALRTGFGLKSPQHVMISERYVHLPELKVIHNFNFIEMCTKLLITR